MTTILYLVIVRLRRILPLEDFRLIENIARDVGKCTICESISPRILITIRIRPTLHHVESSCYYWDQDMCHLDQAVDLDQKICDGCEIIFRSSSKKSYFSQMEFLTNLKHQLV